MLFRSAIIRDAVASQKGSNEAIQKALVAASSVAFNVDYHKKNVQPFSMIVDGLRGTDRQTIIKWIEAHAPAIWRKDTSGKGRFQFNNSFKGEFDFDVLWGEKWYDLVPDERVRHAPAERRAARGLQRRVEDVLVERVDELVLQRQRAIGELALLAALHEDVHAVQALEGILDQSRIGVERLGERG